MNCYSSPTFEPMVAANYPLQSQYDIDNKHHAMGYKQSGRTGWNMGYPNSTMQTSNIQVPFLRDSVSKPRESS